jgi:hypothetical protein
MLISTAAWIQSVVHTSNSKVQIPFIMLRYFPFIPSFLRAYKGGMNIGKTPKKLDSIYCPQWRETNAGTLKQLRPIGEGDQELEKSLNQAELT